MTDDSGFVFGTGPDGRCDDFRVGGAIVDHDAISGQWRMWYYCRDKGFIGPPTLGTGRIAHARSDDGIHWQRIDGGCALGAVFAPSDDAAAFDSLHVGLTDVSRGAGEWLMWYFGGDRRLRDTAAFGPVAGLGMRPGLARSRDGVTWERVAGTAGGGALLDLPNTAIYAAWPNVFHDGRDYLLQVTEAASDLSVFATTTWRSPDARHWTTQGPLLWADGDRDYDAGGMVTRQVLANPLPGGRRFLMVYTATDVAHRRAIAAADSDDGLHWHRLYDEPIFRVGADGAWDSLGVAATRLVIVGARMFLYYYGFQSLGNDAGTRGIGLATAPVGDLRAFRRWNADRVLAAGPPGKR